MPGIHGTTGTTITGTMGPHGPTMRLTGTVTQVTMAPARDGNGINVHKVNGQVTVFDPVLNQNVVLGWTDIDAPKPIRVGMPVQVTLAVQLLPQVMLT